MMMIKIIKMMMMLITMILMVMLVMIIIIMILIIILMSIQNYNCIDNKYDIPSFAVMFCFSSVLTNFLLQSRRARSALSALETCL